MKLRNWWDAGRIWGIKAAHIAQRLLCSLPQVGLWPLLGSSHSWDWFSHLSPKRVKMQTRPFWQQLAHLAGVILAVSLQTLTLLLVHVVKFLDKRMVSGWSLLHHTIFFFPFIVCQSKTVRSLIIEDLCYPFLCCIMKNVVAFQQ